MNDGQRLQEAITELARVRTESEIDLQRYRDEIKRMEDLQALPGSIEILKQGLEEYEVNTANLIAALEQSIHFHASRIQGTSEIDQLRNFIRDVVEPMKASKSAEWIAQGGNEKIFDQAWEKFKFDLVKHEIFRDLGVSMETPDDPEEM